MSDTEKITHRRDVIRRCAAQYKPSDSDALEGEILDVDSYDRFLLIEENSRTGEIYYTLVKTMDEATRSNLTQELAELWEPKFLVDLDAEMYWFGQRSFNVEWDVQNTHGGDSLDLTPPTDKKTYRVGNVLEIEATSEEDAKHQWYELSSIESPDVNLLEEIRREEIAHDQGEHA